MESEKVKEIKKVLDEGQFNTINHHQKEGKPIKISFADILTLINELESENERLNNTEIGELIKENEELEKQCVEWSELDFKKRNKITELKDRIAELEKEKKEHGKKKFLRGWKLGIEEFSERLKNKAIRRQEFIGELAIDDVEYVKVKDVDETLKEFIND